MLIAIDRLVLSGMELGPEPRTFMPEPRELGAFPPCCGAPGLAAGQNASHTRPAIRSGDPHFHARDPRARSGASIFTLELDPEPPIFHLAAAHTYPNLGGGGVLRLINPKAHF